MNIKYKIEVDLNPDSDSNVALLYDDFARACTFAHEFLMQGYTVKIQGIIEDEEDDLFD